MHLAAMSEDSIQSDMLPDAVDAYKPETELEDTLVPDLIADKTGILSEDKDADTCGDRTYAAESSVDSQSDAGTSVYGNSAVMDHVIVPPVLRSAICASYPPAARKEGTEGTAVFLLEIDENGNVIDAVMQKSAGSRILDRAARGAVLKGSFIPGTSDGVPVRSYVTVEVEFRLDK